FNSHMANTAFLAKCVDVRLGFFSEHGFPMSELLRLKLGPVVQRDELEYRREVHLLEQVRVTLALAGLASDGSRWMMRNEFFRLDGKLSASVTSTGGWLDLAARTLTAPPVGLLAALAAL